MTFLTEGRVYPGIQQGTSRRKRRCRNHLGSAGIFLAGRGLQIRIDDYSRSCERLIIAATSTGAISFTPEEIQWIAYYSKKMTSLVDRLLLDPKPKGKHERQTMRDYARTSEALLGVKNLSNEGRESIRDSVADVTGKILDADQGQ
jgi:hypothetical protein